MLVSVTTTGTGEQRLGRRKYRKCSICGEKIDITDNPHGAMPKHKYHNHPEFKAMKDATVAKMRARQMELIQQQKEATAATKEAVASPGTPEAKVAAPPGETLEQQVLDGGNDDQAGSENEDVVDPNGDGSELDGIENIFLSGLRRGNGAGGNGHDPATGLPLRRGPMMPRMEKAASFGEASVAAVVPKAFIINPMLVWIGMSITQTPEFGWPVMPPDKWLDEVIKWFFWYCGWEVTPYRRLTPQEMGMATGG